MISGEHAAIGMCRELQIVASRGVIGKQRKMYENAAVHEEDGTLSVSRL